MRDSMTGWRCRRCGHLNGNQWEWCKNCDLTRRDVVSCDDCGATSEDDSTSEPSSWQVAHGMDTGHDEYSGAVAL